MNSIKDRTLVLHAGGNKAGSTALQHFLVENAAILLRMGFNYFLGGDMQTILHKAGKLDYGVDSEEYRYAFTSGNGHLLLKWMRQDNDRLQFSELMGLYFDSKSECIVSSEMFQRCSTDQWELLSKQCRLHDIHVKIIFYIRDVYPYYFSAWQQRIRNDRYTNSFADFVNDSTWAEVDHINSLERITRVFPLDNVFLIHYETSMRNIAGSFLDVLAIEQDGFDYSSIHRKINRSLTDEERDLLLRLNRTIGHVANFGPELARLLILAAPEVKTDPVFDSNAYDLLLSKYSARIDHINKQFFAGKSILKIIEGNDRLSKRNEQVNRGLTPTEAPHSPQSIVIDWAYRHIRVLLTS